ncbi:hypothetical protein HNR65_002249 [Desulfosalsimonas propionicica]|uniref:Uncharacterized protein n=1 Tax=Desulfosalsimonas propionicica TaxID=332175 RepID=A0A7W0HL56_9BACT|nr:hypothetical protein [Desulfosalsimonas propionicica]MBA2881915.1 hypothetical protein [Desulfosalsimonas propionicica]
MYKRIDHEDKKIEIQEHFHSPMVYLDHWALNDFSLNPSLRERFVSTMNSKGGTLRLSVANMVEISKQEDKSQVESMLSMIRSIEDCGLINIDVSEVIKKENKIVSDPAAIFKVQNPSAELELVSAYLLAKKYPLTWHVADIIETVVNEFPSTNLSRNNDEFLAAMKDLIEKGRNDPVYLKKVKGRFLGLKQRGPRYQTATRELLQFTVDFIIKNVDMAMAQYSEWNDIFHLIVPVAYCDIVMLDRRWVAFMNQTGLSYPQVARTFDRRSIESLFEHIENWAG